MLAANAPANPTPANVMTPARWRLVGGLCCPLLLIAAAVATFMTAARDEDFWWADGASFALNGEMLRDYLASGFAQTPMAFALEWFHRYPALTISLYPPIFPLAEAGVFAVFGFSHAAAIGTVTGFTALAALGMFWMMRTTVGLMAAAGAGVMLLGTPGVLLWSREIVLDVPAMAFLLLAAAALLRYQAIEETGRGRGSLLPAVLLTLAAAYTKQTALFVAPAFVVALLADQGRDLLRRKSTWIALGVGIGGLVPLAVFTVLFGNENFHIAFGSGTGQKGYGRLSWQALCAYGRVMPDIIVGIVPLLGALSYLVLVLVRGFRANTERRLTVLMFAWLIVDYLCVSVTADFEPRYAIPLTVPPVVLSVLLLTRLLAPLVASGVAVTAGVALLVWQISIQPVTRVEGYGDVAQYILDHTTQDDAVLFHGMASKNFTFSIRTRSPTPKIYIVRAEKFLVDYNITRDWGITDHNLTSAEIETIVNRNNFAFIVFQPNFWTDQPSIATLQRLIDSDRFRLVAQFGITSEDRSRQTPIRVYRDIHAGPPAAQAVGGTSRPIDATVPGRL